MTETQSLPPLLSQMILSKLGLYCSERLSNDIYFLNESINLLLPTLDLESIKQEYDKKFGERSWDKVMKKKSKIDRKLSESKTFYDAISDKSLLKKGSIPSVEENIQKTFKKFFFRTSLKISIIQPDIYNLFVFLLNHSSLQRMQIKNEYFRNLEQRTNRKITMDSKNKTQTSN